MSIQRFAFTIVTSWYGGEKLRAYWGFQGGESFSKNAELRHS
jgi:hypothetical protein